MSLSGTLMRTLGLEKELEQSGPGNMAWLSIVSSLWLKGQGGSQIITSIQDEASLTISGYLEGNKLSLEVLLLLSSKMIF